MITRCTHCPAHLDHVCLARKTGHYRYCELVVSHEGYRELVRSQSEPSDGSPIVTMQAEPIDTVKLVAIETCDFRRSDCNCLSKPSDCQLGGYTARVLCMDCKEIT
jgi:hypothetical protein